MQLEKRFLCNEIRAKESDSRTVEGYALKFGTLSQDFGGWFETIDPDAEILFEDVRAYLNHDANHLLGRLSSNTLRLTRDSVGLKAEIDLPETQSGEDTLRLIKRGDISQMSFAFRTLPDGALWDDSKGKTIRHLRGFRLFDVSPVSEPAYPDTEIWARSFELARQEFSSLRSAEKAKATINEQKLREAKALSLAARAASL